MYVKIYYPWHLLTANGVRLSLSFLFVTFVYDCSYNVELYSKSRDVNSPKCYTTIHWCGFKVSRSPVQLYVITNKVSHTRAPISVSNLIWTRCSNLATSRVECLNAKILITGKQRSRCGAFRIIKSESYLLYSSHDNTILNFAFVRNHERDHEILTIQQPIKQFQFFNKKIHIQRKEGAYTEVTLFRTVLTASTVHPHNVTSCIYLQIVVLWRSPKPNLSVVEPRQSAKLSK